MADNTGAAFGVFPQMRPRRARQDREAAANAPLSLLRGWAAGTAGLPGDIEGLLRMLTPGVSNEPALPTSDFYKEWLPGRSLNETPTGRAFTEAGSLTGGAGLGPLSRVAATGANVAGRGALAAGRAGERLAERVVPQVMERNGMGAQLLRDLSQGSSANVIKPRGGNWLSGSVEEALKKLKPIDVQLEQRYHNTPEEAAASLQERFPAGMAINNWIDKQLTRYVKNEMATPEDPIRALAERGVLHVNPEGLQSVRAPKSGPAELSKKMGKSDVARDWENASDSALSRRYFEQFSDQARPKWLKPGVPVYGLEKSDNLGFNHLIDELRNAVNPESGLPRELLLKYSSLPQVSVPQAVQRVADINAWRAAQKAEADLARANNAAIVLHKEYPEKGMKWVELRSNLKKPVDAVQDKYGEWWPVDESGARIQMPGGAAGASSREEAMRSLEDSALADALKYEGDTMGHCVGGYCPDVLEGRSRIYSLRDSKGQPHVTIEVKPKTVQLPDKFSDLWDIAMKHVSEDAPGWERLNEYGDPYEVLKEYHGAYTDNPQGVIEGILEYFPEALSATMADLTKVGEPMINQIKGKGNRAPNPEYLPYVQDFVKSGKWSDVGDLQNTGLQRADWQADTLKALQDLGIEAPAYGTADEINSVLNRLNKARGFATGGLVQNTYNQAKIDALAQQLQEELYA